MGSQPRGKLARRSGSTGHLRGLPEPNSNTSKSPVKGVFVAFVRAWAACGSKLEKSRETASMGPRQRGHRHSTMLELSRWRDAVALRLMHVPRPVRGDPMMKFEKTYLGLATLVASLALVAPLAAATSRATARPAKPAAEPVPTRRRPKSPASGVAAPMTRTRDRQHRDPATDHHRRDHRWLRDRHRHRRRDHWHRPAAQRFALWRRRRV